MIAKTRQFKKGSLEQKLFPWGLGLLILILLGFLIISNIKLSKKRAKLENQITKYNKQIQQLKQNQQKLETEIKDKQFLEQVARNQLNLQKPGEKVVVVKKEERIQSPEPEPQLSWWQRLWDKSSTFFTKKVLDKIKFWE